MDTSSLLAVSFGMKVVAGLFIVCSILLILIILVQKGKGGGLSAAFGGGGGGGVLGTKTGDFLTWVTIALVVVWFFLAIVMAKYYKPKPGDFGTTPPPKTETQVPNQPGTAPAAPGIPDTNETTN